MLVLLSLRWIDPPTSSFILQHNADVLFDDSREFASHQWTDFDDISPDMALAVIASEDQRFPSHHGIDTTELSKALQSDGASRRGASTITQQTAKNLFLWPGRSYIRKGIEAVLAILMELILPKQRILEIYLNIAQTGSGQFGVTDAAKNYFGKFPGELNKYEAARIAAILPSPGKYSATNPSSYIQQRQRWIMKQMEQLGGVSVVKSL